MSRVFALIAIACAAAASAQQPELSYVQLENGGVRDSATADMNGDGRSDLVVSTGPIDGARWLHVHFARNATPKFASAPDRKLRLVRDAVAFTVADVDPEPGHEIVLLSPSRAAAVVWSKGSTEPRYVALARIELLWQPADPERCFSWQPGVCDLNGDGLDDLLLPEPSGYRVALQRRAADTTFETTRLEVPLDEDDTEVARRGSALSRTSVRLELTLGDDEAGPMVRVTDGVPAPQAIDQDGDGRADVVALSGTQLLVWRQLESGGFSAEPNARADFGSRLETRTQRWALKALLRELDGTPGAEIVVLSTQDRGGDVFTTLEVFADLESIDANKHSDKLRLRGWSSSPEFDDVDADGRADLSIGSLRVDALAALGGGGDKNLEGQINLFRNGFEGPKGRFARPVALAHRVQLPTDELRGGRSAVARFFRDADGDGVRDLLLAVGDQLRLYITQKRGRRFRLGEPSWQLELVDDAAVQLDEESGLVLVREPKQVIVVGLGS